MQMHIAANHLTSITFRILNKKGKVLISIYFPLALGDFALNSPQKEYQLIYALAPPEWGWRRLSFV